MKGGEVAPSGPVGPRIRVGDPPSPPQYPSAMPSAALARLNGPKAGAAANRYAGSTGSAPAGEAAADAIKSTTETTTTRTTDTARSSSRLVHWSTGRSASGPRTPFGERR